MKNIKNFVLAVSVMVGISGIESNGILFWIALAMVFVPFAVLGIEEWNKQAKIRKFIRNEVSNEKEFEELLSKYNLTMYKKQEEQP